MFRNLLNKLPLRMPKIQKISPSQSGSSRDRDIRQMKNNESSPGANSLAKNLTPKQNEQREVRFEFSDSEHSKNSTVDIFRRRGYAQDNETATGLNILHSLEQDDIPEKLTTAQEKAFNPSWEDRRYKPE